MVHPSYPLNPGIAVSEITSVPDKRFNNHTDAEPTVPEEEPNRFRLFVALALPCLKRYDFGFEEMI